MDVMSQLIITIAGTAAFAACVHFFLSAVKKMLDEDGISCQSCLDTGFDVSSVVATACKHGCQENHDSPFWDIAASMK